jgi:hypothetical protein
MKHKVQHTTNNDGSPFNVQNDGNPFNDPNDGSPFNVQNDGNPFLNGLLGLSRAGRIAVVLCVVRAAAVWIGERITAIGVIKMTFVAVVRLLVRMAVVRVMCGIAVVRLVRDSPSNTHKLGQIKFSTKSMRLPSIWFSEGSSMVVYEISYSYLCIRLYLSSFHLIDLDHLEGERACPGQKP